MFGTTNNAIHTNTMSEFETSPTLLCFQLLSSCNLSQLDAGHSIYSIASSTGLGSATISKLHFKEHSSLQKSTGGHPSKLSPTNFRHAQHLITSGQAENAVQVTKALLISQISLSLPVLFTLT